MREITPDPAAGDGGTIRTGAPGSQAVFESPRWSIVDWVRRAIHDPRLPVMRALMLHHDGKGDPQRDVFAAHATHARRGMRCFSTDPIDKGHRVRRNLEPGG